MDPSVENNVSSHGSNTDEKRVDEIGVASNDNIHDPHVKVGHGETAKLAGAKEMQVHNVSIL